MLTTAQSLYISRLPRLLNQVQERRAFSVAGVSEGTRKLKEEDGPLGHPPMYEWTTWNVFPPSSDNEAWHEPPPCGAPPPMVML